MRGLYGGRRKTGLIIIISNSLNLIGFRENSAVVYVRWEILDMLDYDFLDREFI